jgi:hypothetical protein
MATATVKYRIPVRYCDYCDEKTPVGIMECEHCGAPPEPSDYRHLNDVFEHYIKLD